MGKRVIAGSILGAIGVEMVIFAIAPENWIFGAHFLVWGILLCLTCLSIAIDTIFNG